MRGTTAGQEMNEMKNLVSRIEGITLGAQANLVHYKSVNSN